MLTLADMAPLDLSRSSIWSEKAAVPVQESWMSALLPSRLPASRGTGLSVRRRLFHKSSACCQPQRSQGIDRVDEDEIEAMRVLAVGKRRRERSDSVTEEMIQGERPAPTPH